MAASVIHDNDIATQVFAPLQYRAKGHAKKNCTPRADLALSLLKDGLLDICGVLADRRVTRAMADRLLAVAGKTRSN